jgi:hypothetical protein
MEVAAKEEKLYPFAAILADKVKNGTPVRS